MGFWICDDFPGDRFYEVKEVRFKLEDELHDLTLHEFYEWLDGAYTVHTLYYGMVSKSNFAESLFFECSDALWKTNSNLEYGHDGTALEHEFYWVASGEGLHDRKRKPFASLGKRIALRRIKIPRKR